MFTALFVVIALLSEVVGTIAGFGSSVFFVPLAGFFFGFHQVLALTSILHVFSNAAKLVFFGRHVRLRLLVLIGVPSVAGVIAGAYLSTTLRVKFDQLILGLFLIGFSLLLLCKPTVKISATKFNAIGAGGVAGFLAGLIGTGGALRGLALAAFDLEKGVFVATSAGIDSGVDFSRMVIYLRSGYLAPNSLTYIGLLFIIAFVGSYLGKQALGYIDQKHFRKVVLGFVLVIGVTTLGRAISDAFDRSLKTEFRPATRLSQNRSGVKDVGFHCSHRRFPSLSRIPVLALFAELCKLPSRSP